MLLQRKIAITIFIVSACCFFMTVGLISIQANELLQDRSTKQAEETTKRYAQNLIIDLEKIIDATRHLSASFGAFQEHQTNQATLKNMMTSLLQKTVVKNSMVFSVDWIYEMSTLSSDLTIQELYRQDNYLKNVAKKFDIKNFHNIKDNNSDILLKPRFLDENRRFLTSNLLVPIFKNNQFAGIINIDINIQEIQRKMNEMNLNHAKIYLIHKDGTFLSHPDSSKIMTNIQNNPHLNRIFMNSAMNNVLIQTRQKDDLNQYFTMPLDSDILKSDWLFIVAYPLNQMSSDNNLLHKFSFIIAISSTLFITFILIFLLRQFIYRPLVDFSNHILYINTHGNLSEEFIYSGSDDELKDAINAFNQFTSNLNLFVNECSVVVNKLSHGNFNKNIETHAKGDLLILKKNINESVFNIKSFCSNIEYINHNLQTGYFKPSQEHEYLSGDYKQILDEMNQVMLQIDEAISSIRSLSNALINQNYTAIIENRKFMGDLEILRVQLNQILIMLNNSQRNIT